MGVFSKLLKSTIGIDLDRKRVLETGEPATATILSIKQTGKAITYGGANIHYQADMLLEIQPANNPAFQARVTHFIPVIEIPQYQLGQVLAVKYDPKDKAKVAIVGIAMPTVGSNERKTVQFPVGMDPAKVEAIILQSEAMKQELDFTGELAPAQILKVEDTKIRAGANPFYKFHILVEPQNTTPFQAAAQGFIAFQDLSKYQVGSRVWVKFDPKDHNKVVIVGGEIALTRKIMYPLLEESTFSFLPVWTPLRSGQRYFIARLWSKN